MSLWKIAWRSIQQRALASTLTALSMALGVALVVAVLVAQGVIRDSFTRGAGGYHLVVGKKGSQLQLVLNTVYHLQDPIENVPYSFYKEFVNTPGHSGRFAPYVQVAIPYCLGDNYEGFRVVGTVPALFDEFEYAGGKKYEFQSGGRNFEQEHFFEAVIGSAVAHKTGLKVGDEFQPTHGLSNEGDGHKHDAFKIVGILKPTGTANDRALFINMEGFFLLDKHAKPVDEVAAAHGDEHHDAEDAHHHDEHAEHDHDDGAMPAADVGEQDANHPAHDDHEHSDAAKPDADHHHDEQPGEAHSPHDAVGGGAEHSEHDHAAHDPAAPDHDAHAGDDHDHDAHSHVRHDHDAHDHTGHDHEGHDHHHEPLPDDQREVTAILVLASDDFSAEGLRTTINEGEVAQAASPIRVINDFFKTMVSGVTIALLALTVLIIVVAGVGVMVSIYNSMNDRRRDIAVMRALGAGRGTVLSVILFESILLSLGGGLLGFVLGHTLVGVLGPIVEAFSGVTLGFMQFVSYELILIPGLIVLAALTGYLPAMSAYRTDVGKALSASP
ncbi:MAG TPA: ABC transporter permease [Pirellulales bacterium]|jgi:putative ABC transport system permease protein